MPSVLWLFQCIQDWTLPLFHYCHFFQLTFNVSSWWATHCSSILKNGSKFLDSLPVKGRGPMTPPVMVSRNKIWLKWHCVTSEDRLDVAIITCAWVSGTLALGTSCHAMGSSRPKERPHARLFQLIASAELGLAARHVKDEYLLMILVPGLQFFPAEAPGTVEWWDHLTCALSEFLTHTNLWA